MFNISNIPVVCKFVCLLCSLFYCTFANLFYIENKNHTKKILPGVFLLIQQHEKIIKQKNRKNTNKKSGPKNKKGATCVVTNKNHKKTKGSQPFFLFKPVKVIHNKRGDNSPNPAFKSSEKSKTKKGFTANIHKRSLPFTLLLSLASVASQASS